jgi:hypothetical protein
MHLRGGRVAPSLSPAACRGDGCCAIAWRAALRFTVLTAALVCYGAVPSTPFVQSEIEAQVEALAAETAHGDVRTRLRGGDLRRSESITLAAAMTANLGGAAGRCAAACRLGERLSFGHALPLRC